MKIAVGTPATIPGVAGDLMLEWSRRADAGSFSSLVFVDRIVYPNYEVMTAMGAAAAVTSRIRLMPTILIGPLRSAGLLAKQAATIDVLSNGRLTLGLGVGTREDDFTATEAGYKDRGKRFDRQLETMQRIWNDEPYSEQAGPIGPSPVQSGGPELSIGGFAPAALARIARSANGFIGGGDPRMMGQAYRQVEDGWRAAGRSGRPRFVAVGYFALGPDAAERGGAIVRHYYAFLPQYADMIASALPSSPDSIKQYIRVCEEAGADEVALVPTIPELDQLDRLADVV